MELTGNLTFEDLNSAGNLTYRIQSNAFQNINGLFNLLVERGSLTLRDAVLTLPENAAHHLFLSCNVLKLINTKIIINSSDLTIICNEYEHTNSSIICFDSSNGKAENGKDAIAEGYDGLFGDNGLSAGNCNFFVTNRVRSIGGGINVDMSGQDAGHGGRGADGKNGERGRTGRNCADGPLWRKANCGNGHTGGNGQNGGTGGNGGFGGSAGKFEFRFHGNKSINDYFFNYVGNGGKYGFGGNPGRGGQAGEGGTYGRSTCTYASRTCSNGQSGKNGENGLHGHSGENGDDSFLINSNFDVQFIIFYLNQFGKSDIPKDVEAFEGFTPVFEISNGLSESAD